jgi:hypothetical protein
VPAPARSVADPGGDLGGLAVQDLARLVSDPVPGVGVAGLEEAPGGFPEVFEHVDEDRTRCAR